MDCQALSLKQLNMQTPLIIDQRRSAEINEVRLHGAAAIPLSHRLGSLGCRTGDLR